LDSVTLEDWGEEIFAEGVGIKWRKWVRGEGEGKKYYTIPPLHQTSTTVAHWCHCCTLYNKHVPD